MQVELGLGLGLGLVGMRRPSLLSSAQVRQENESSWENQAEHDAMTEESQAKKHSLVHSLQAEREVITKEMQGKMCDLAHLLQAEREATSKRFQDFDKRFQMMKEEHEMQDREFISRFEDGDDRIDEMDKAFKNTVVQIEAIMDDFELGKVDYDADRTVMTLGKFKGMTYLQIVQEHKDYALWAMKQEDPVPAMREFQKYARAKKC